jgi:hypothetical protein
MCTCGVGVSPILIFLNDYYLKINVHKSNMSHKAGFRNLIIWFMNSKNQRFYIGSSFQYELNEVYGHTINNDVRDQKPANECR